MQQRNNAISFLHTFGIILVVLGHSFYAYKQLYDENYLYDWRKFAMPLFMFMSGYLLKYTARAKHRPLGGMTAGGVCSFLAKKAKRLLIPYAVISSAVFLPKALLSVYAMHPVELSLSSYVEMLVYPDYNAIRLFWFLPTLFVMFCMVAAGAYILRVMRLKVHPLIILLVLLLPHVTPLSAGDIRLFNISKAINIHLLYFAAGYYFCKYGKMENFIAVHRGLVFGVTFVISIAMLLLPDGDVKSLLLAFNGIAMSFAIAHIYVGRKWSFLNPYFEASYAIYLFSWFPQVFVQQFLLSFMDMPWLLNTALAFSSGFFVPYLIYRLIMRYKHTKVGKVVALLTGQ
ncbi:MAG TPA: acyltransferase [Candidatus Avibacteroides excrementipullorum]|nr:acyltransferase [Candidatus Avibacteroides excrementipullorum]